MIGVIISQELEYRQQKNENLEFARGLLKQVHEIFEKIDPKEGFNVKPRKQRIKPRIQKKDKKKA